MKKFIISALLFCGVISPSFLYSTELLFNQSDFSKGVNTNDLPDTIYDNQVVEASNFWFNKNNGITRREGFGLKVTTRAAIATNSWNFIDTSGNDWLLVLYADGVLIAGKSLGLSGNNFSVIVSTNFSLSQPTDAAVGLGKIWFENKQDGLSWWDGVNFTSSSIAPKASSIKIWRNRVCIGDIVNEVSSVRFSGELTGDDWTNNSRFSTSPISIRIGGVNDGERVYGLSVGNDELLVFKKRSLYGISGNDQRDFYVRQISDSIGSIYPKTAKQYFMSTVFLSNRGLDSYTPSNTFNFIGNNIKDQLDSLAILGSVSRYQTVTDQTVFGDGISNPENNISSNVIVGDLTEITFSTTDTNSQDFGKGTVRRTMNLPTASWSMYINTSTYNSIIFESSAILRGVYNSTFELNADNWTQAIPITCPGGGADGSNCYMSGSNESFDFYLQTNDASQVTALYSTAPVTHTDWVRWTWDTTADEGKYGILRFNGFNAQTTKNYYVMFSTSIAMYIKGGAGASNIAVDSIYIPTSSARSSQLEYQSQTFTRGVTITSYTNVQFISSYTLNNSSITFSIKNSTDNYSWKSENLISTIVPRQFLDGQYFQYVASFCAISPVGSTYPVKIQIDENTIGAYTTGYYQIILNPGGNLTSWGLFSAVTTGSITFRVQSSSDLIFENNQWVNQVLNSTIPQPTFPYLGVRALFYTAVATNPSTIQSFTVNWNEGEAPPIPLAATNQDNYFLFFGTMTGVTSTNDSTIIYEQNNSLTNFSGINAGGVTEYANKLTIADAKPTGNIYVLETSTNGTDADIKIPSIVKFKRIGSMVDKKKDWEYFFFTLSRKNVSQSQIFRISYYVDGATTTWFTDNVELSTGVYAGNFRSNVPGDNQRESQFIDVKIEELTQSYPYSIHGVRGYGTLVDIR